MRSTILIARLFVLASIVSCQAYGPTTPTSGINNGGGGGGGGGGITVNDNFFAPVAATIVAGQTVTWTWVGAGSHTVTFADGVGSSGIQSSGTHSRTFPVAGAYPYTCTQHTGMAGTVIVQ